LFSSSALNCVWVHQQGGCGMPVAAWTFMAHWLGWPHSGQFWGLKAGVSVMMRTKKDGSRYFKNQLASQAGSPLAPRGMGRFTKPHETVGADKHLCDLSRFCHKLHLYFNNY
jgi:hypothetical protein